VEVTVDEGNAAALSESVGAGRLDAAFIRRPVTERSGLAYLVLAEEPMLAALPMDHPLAQKARRTGRERIRLADLANDPFILVRRPGASGMYGDLIEACHSKGFAPRVVAEVNQMFTNVTMVAAGIGVSVVPASMRDFHREAVFYAGFSDAPRLTAPLTLVTSIGRANPTLERFVAFAQEVAGAPKPLRGSKGHRPSGSGGRDAQTSGPGRLTD
jgi:DNA-binding transcriptional LysR family regulator